MAEDKSSRRFDVEHTVLMKVRQSFVLPAKVIYDSERLKEHMSIIERCHVYIIGFLPIIETTGPAQLENNTLITQHKIAGEECDIRWDHLKLPEGCTIKIESSRWWLLDADGYDLSPPDEKDVLKFLNMMGLIGFKVMYVGQAFGENGERNSIDRLLKHETLQKIALEGPPSGHTISILLLEVEPRDDLLMVYNPKAKVSGNTLERIESGLDKLYNTSEAERVSLYEASLIRYFQPYYNKIYKGCFPSTNLTILANCYEKDIAVLAAELALDTPFQLFSDRITKKQEHAVVYHLHKSEDRRLFFDFLNLD